MTDHTTKLANTLREVTVGVPATGGLPRRVRTRARVAMARTALVLTALVAITTTIGVAAIDKVTDRRGALLPVGEPSNSPSDMIAFVSDRDGDPDIYSMTVGGDDVVNLTDDDASDLSPSWSPDGTRIAFSSDREGDAGIYVMGADGSNPHPVVSDATHPDWSPDGTSIAFERAAVVSEGGPSLSQIFVLDLSTREVEQITRDEAGAVGPDWSPDGSRIAYSALGHVTITDLNGGIVRVLSHGSVDMNPLWQPGSSALLFARETAFVDDRSISSVFALDTDGDASPRQVTSLHDRSIVPESFSRDGGRVLVTVYDEGAGDVYVMDSNGDRMEPLVEGPSDDSSAAWRPR